MTKIIQSKPRSPADSDKDSEEFDPYRYGPIPISTSFFKELISAPLPEASPDELYQDTLPPGVAPQGKPRRSTARPSPRLAGDGQQGGKTSRRWLLILLPLTGVAAIFIGHLTARSSLTPHQGDAARNEAVLPGEAVQNGRALQNRPAQADKAPFFAPNSARATPSVADAQPHAAQSAAAPRHNNVTLREAPPAAGKVNGAAKKKPGAVDNLYYEF